MKKEAYVDELIEAFAQKGCAFCRLLDESADKFVDAVLWEMVNDPPTRLELRHTRGYCAEHSRLLIRPGAALGTAILMKDVINALQKEVQNSRLWEGESGLDGLRASVMKRPSAKTAVLLQKLEPQATCPACVNVAYLKKHLIKSFSQNLQQLDAPYRQSDGLCLPHFKDLLAETGSPPTAQTLLQAQMHIWNRLDAELTEFIRKNDYRFQHEGFGAEKDAWIRAVEALGGTLPQNKQNKKGLTQ
jgi:hypothetical protein